MKSKSMFFEEFSLNYLSNSKFANDLVRNSSYLVDDTFLPKVIQDALDKVYAKKSEGNLIFILDHLLNKNILDSSYLDHRLQR